MALSALVEAVDLELEPVEAAFADQVVLQKACGVVGESAAAEVGMDGEAAQLRDAAALVRDGEAHDACASAVELDDEASEVLRLALGALDLLEQLVARRGSSRGEERVDIVVARQRDEELDVVGSSAPDRHVHGRAGSTASGGALGRSSPEPSATPARISTRPTTIHAVISSSSSNAP